MKYLIIILLSSIFYINDTYAAKPVFVDSFNSAIKIKELNKDKNILVIFGAGWCKYCDALKSDINSGSLDHLLDNKIVCYIDIDKNTDLKNEYKISSIPDSRIIESKKTISKITGYSKKEYIQWLDKNSQ